MSYTFFWEKTIDELISERLGELLPEERSELALDAEQAYRGWKHLRGEFIPSWDDLSDEQRNRFIYAVYPLLQVEAINKSVAGIA